jgi:hypothetical protein
VSFLFLRRFSDTFDRSESAELCRVINTPCQWHVQEDSGVGFSSAGADFRFCETNRTTVSA